MIGEIGGGEEEKGAAFVRDHMTKPVVGFIAGRTAPPGKRMGHAGAVISGGLGTAEAKMAAMREAGITVVDGPHLLGRAMKDALARHGRVKTRTPAGKRSVALAGPARKGNGTAAAPPAQRGGKATKKAAKRERE
jgi:succinyl-CoA synthetase alpha subunit